MNETVRLIIEIPKKAQVDIAKIRFLIGGKEDRILQQTIINAIKNGIPLDDVKAEIQAKEMVETDVARQFYNMALADAINLLDYIGKESEDKK